MEAIEKLKGSSRSSERGPSSGGSGMIIEGMQAAKAAGAVVSFDLNFRAKLWQISGGLETAQQTLRKICANVDVLVGNEEDLQMGLGIPGPDVHAKSKLDPSAFLSMMKNVTSETVNKTGISQNNLRIKYVVIVNSLET